jgi:uncharacterized protein (TIGR00369 family)
MTESRIDIPKLQGHHCFACGTDNPIGLNLQFYQIGEAVCTDIALDKVYEGWEGMVHGGIISTLIDEVMSWTIMYSKKVFLVTRNMNIKYVKPVMIGTPLRVKGRLVDDSEPPRIKASAEIRDHDGRLLVKGSGEFVAVPKEKLNAIPESFKEQMDSLFDRFPASSNNT